MKKYFLGGLAAAALAGMGYGLAARGTAAGPESERPWVGHGPAVVAANGITEGARREVPVRPEVQGTIAALNVRDDQEVAEGALLVELENEEQKAQVDKAEADLSIARADLEKLCNGERLLVRQVAAALSRSRENAYKMAQDSCQRAQNAQYGVSLLDRQKAEYAMRQARDEWEMAKKQQELAEAPPRHEDVTRARGVVKQAEAQLRKARADLAKTQLRAPYACRVLKVFSEPGELVGPGSSQPALLLADLSRLRVRAFVEELDAFKVRSGQRAVITVDGLPDREFTGTVAVVLQRMGTRTLQREAPGEYKDVHAREVLIDVKAGEELPLNLRVRVWIDVRTPQASTTGGQ